MLATTFITAGITSLVGILILVVAGVACKYLEVPLDVCYNYLSIDDWLNHLPW